MPQIDALRLLPARTPSAGHDQRHHRPFPMSGIAAERSLQISQPRACRNGCNQLVSGLYASQVMIRTKRRTGRARPASGFASHANGSWLGSAHDDL
jgi:hypothetical protein